MLVRARDGAWCSVAPAAAIDAAEIAQLSRTELSALLELDGARAIVAERPELNGLAGPDAVCVRPDGSVSLLLRLDEGVERTLLRLMNALGTMRGWTPAGFLRRLGHAGESSSPGQWLARRLDGGDPPGLEEGLARSLRDTRMEILLIGDQVPPRLAPSLQLLDGVGCTVRCFRLELSRGTTMEALRATELPLSADAPAATAAPPAAAAPAPIVRVASDPTAPAAAERVIPIDTGQAKPWRRGARAS